MIVIILTHIKPLSWDRNSLVSITVANGLYNRTLTAQPALPWGGVGLETPLYQGTDPGIPGVRVSRQLYPYESTANGPTAYAIYRPNIWGGLRTLRLLR